MRTRLSFRRVHSWRVTCLHDVTGGYWHKTTTATPPAEMAKPYISLIWFRKETFYEKKSRCRSSFREISLPVTRRLSYVIN